MIYGRENLLLFIYAFCFIFLWYHTDSACSHLRLEPDWPSILLICDLIRQNDATYV